MSDNFLNIVYYTLMYHPQKRSLTNQIVKQSIIKLMYITIISQNYLNTIYLKLTLTYLLNNRDTMLRTLHLSY